MEQVEDVQKLIQEIDTKHTGFGTLSNAIKQLDELLATHTTGRSIEYLYEKVPEELSGYVELYLDLQHRPKKG